MCRRKRSLWGGKKAGAHTNHSRQGRRQDMARAAPAVPLAALAAYAGHPRDAMNPGCSEQCIHGRSYGVPARGRLVLRMRFRLAGLNWRGIGRRVGQPRSMMSPLACCALS